MGVCDVRGATARLRRWNDDHKSRRWNCNQTERIRCRADENVRRDGAAFVVRMIDDGTRSGGNGIVMTGQVRVQRLTVMVLGLVRVEMHVHQRRADRANLHDDDEDGRGQPAQNHAIVVKDEPPRI